MQNDTPFHIFHIQNGTTYYLNYQKIKNCIQFFTSTTRKGIFKKEKIYEECLLLYVDNLWTLVKFDVQGEKSATSLRQYKVKNRFVVASTYDEFCVCFPLDNGDKQRLETYRKRLYNTLEEEEKKSEKDIDILYHHRLQTRLKKVKQQLDQLQKLPTEIRYIITFFNVLQNALPIAVVLKFEANRVLSRFFNMETLDKKLLDENSWNIRSVGPQQLSSSEPLKPHAIEPVLELGMELKQSSLPSYLLFSAILLSFL